jgi:hypothetical protein
MMKTKTLYSVRRYRENEKLSSKPIGYKMRLVSRAQALRICKFMLRRGVDVFAAPLRVNY